MPVRIVVYGNGRTKNEQCRGWASTPFCGLLCASQGSCLEWYGDGLDFSHLAQPFSECAHFCRYLARCAHVSAQLHVWRTHFTGACMADGLYCAHRRSCWQHSLGIVLPPRCGLRHRCCGCGRHGPLPTMECSTICVSVHKGTKRLLSWEYTIRLSAFHIPSLFWMRHLLLMTCKLKDADLNSTRSQRR